MKTKKEKKDAEVVKTKKEVDVKELKNVTGGGAKGGFAIGGFNDSRY